MEPPSPIQALGISTFPSRFIIRTVPRGDFARNNNNWSHYRRNSARNLIPRSLSLTSRKNPGCGWSCGSQNLEAWKGEGTLSGTREELEMSTTPQKIVLHNATERGRGNFPSILCTNR